MFWQACHQKPDEKSLQKRLKIEIPCRETVTRKRLKEKHNLQITGDTKIRITLEPNDDCFRFELTFRGNLQRVSFLNQQSPINFTPQYVIAALKFRRREIDIVPSFFSSFPLIPWRNCNVLDTISGGFNSWKLCENPGIVF